MKESIKKYQFKDGLHHEFEIVDLQKKFNASKAMMTIPHRAQFYHVLFIEKGKGTHYVDFNPITVEDNCLVFIPHNSVNRFDAQGEYAGRGIIFTDNFFCKNQQDMQYLRSSILFSDLYGTAILKLTKQPNEVSSIIGLLEDEAVKEPDALQYHVLHNLLHVFLLQAERALRLQGFQELKPSANRDCLVLFKNLLEQRFLNEKSVQYYAAELSISEKQLHKATTTLIDKTPKQIIDERVLLESKRLLVHSASSIKEIAYQLGYEEPTNFIKYFRKHLQQTPSEFREKNSK
jgi:AraC-like DNA-binding protein